MPEKSLRIVFMGTPEFAVESLNILVENGYNIVGVITAPDKPAGRGQKLQPSAVKAYAVEKGLNVLQPTNLKDPLFAQELKSLNADLQIIVAFRMLPEVIWNMPPLGSFNLHASLLPQYRGAAPINWAVINGDTETGVSTFFLQHEIDTGNIIAQRKIAIEPHDNAGSVHDKLMTVGAKLVLDTVITIEKGTVTTTPQQTLSEGVALNGAPKIFKDDCRIKWNNTAVSIHNLVRGLSPYPAAWSELKKANGESLMIKIFETSPAENSSLNPGDIHTDNKTFVKVGCCDGALTLKSIQPAGKKRMTIEEFLRGHKLEEGCFFE
jgi:methionyl-tRNA formyltransferase